MGEATVTVYISDCKQYVARTRTGDYVAMPDVFDRHGNVWRGGRYRATGWDDTDPRYVYPEFRFMVVSWGNKERRKRTGEWVRGFRVSFGEYDQTKRWREVDAQIGPRLEAEFHKECPPKRPPKWVGEIMESAVWKLEL